MDAVNNLINLILIAYKYGVLLDCRIYFWVYNNVCMGDT